MDTSLHFDRTTHNELLLAIQWYLAQSPCKEASGVLRREIEQLNLLPRRYDFTGAAHLQPLERYETSIPRDQPSLVTLIERLNFLVCKAIPPVISYLPLRLFSSKKQSLCRNEATKSCVNCSAAYIFQSRQLGRRFPRHQMLPKETVQSLGLHCRISGHLSSIFCVAFDRTGHYIFTGADDRLVKVWSATSGLLRFTLRGHSAQITDISVSDDNSFLASGSLDKTMRVWSLRSAASLALFRHHTAAVTLITFLPYVCGRARYLLSTGGDCVANFYKYASDDESFSNYEHISFNERASPGSRLVSSCCSPGGSLVVIGDTHRFLRIFRLSENGVSKLRDIEAHTDRVDSLAWAHSGLKFVSGSKDGIAKVWRFRYNEWESVILDTKKRDEKLSVNSRRAYKVTMVCWTLEDDFVVTSGSDHALVVWDPVTGNSLKQLEGHKEDTYVLIAHPLYREYVFSAGHDGLFMIWNVSDGTLVKRYQNQEEVNGSVPLFDFSMSPDGTVVAAVDSLGRLSIFGMGASQKVKTTPKEQFFITDYMPVTYDLSGELIDEDTATAPHLMPPSMLVDGDGNEYSMDIQRLVPGRDSLREERVNEGRILPSPWLGRDLVQRLPSSTINILNYRLEALRELEAKDYAREACRRKPVDVKNDEQLTRQPTSSVKRKNTARSSARLMQAYVRQTSEGTEEDIGPEEIVTSNTSGDSTFDTASSDDEDSEISEDTSDSDYSLEVPVVSRRRRVRNSDASDSNGDYGSSKKRPVRRCKKARNDFGDDESDGEPFVDGSDDSELSLPGRSAKSGGRGGRSRQRCLSSSSEITVSTASSSTGSPASPIPGPSRRIDSPVQSFSRRRSVVPVVEFPSWMRLVRPCRFPYIAQIGDVVMYFRQGHEMYLNSVETLRLYPVTQRMRPLAQLDAEEMCLVKYVRRPYRLISVKLARLDDNETPTGLVFSVKYHDLENIPDFIILHRLYAESTALIYEPGDRIESILDVHWWSGTIDKKEPFDEVNFPRSHWYSLTVRWDTGEDEKMSPWDVQLIGAERRTGLATEEELFEYSYVPRLEVDWNCCGGSAEECERRLIDAVESLREEDDVKPFCMPVNLKDYPEYSLNVDYPIDLDTISKRAANKFYRRFASMEQDIKYIAINATIFNEPRSSIVRNSRALVETLIQFLKSPQVADVRTLFNSLKIAPDHELVEYKKPCRIRIPSITENGSTSASHTFDCHLDSAVTGFSAQEWINDCIRIVDTMSQSAFGRFLVDDGSETLSAAVSDGCHSLSSILSSIERRTYDSPQQVVDDVQKLLQSYRALVDDKRSPLYLHSLTFSSRFNNAMAPILAKWQRFQQLSSNVHSNENGAANSLRHLRNRHRKSSHVYNTRQKRTVDSKSENCVGPSSLRSGRNARMPNGFYRNLNNGIHSAEALETQRSTRRKARQRNGEVSGYSESKTQLFADTEEATRSGPSIPNNFQSTRVSIVDDMLCSDVPGPSCSKVDNITVGQVSSRRRKVNRRSLTKVSKSESADDEQLKNDEDYVLEDDSSGGGQSDASDLSFSSDEIGMTKRSNRTRKRRRVRDNAATEITYANGKSKRGKRFARTKSTSAESFEKDRVAKKRKRKRIGFSTHSRSGRSAYIIERTPESGVLSDDMNTRSARSRRLRDRIINYNEGDEQEECLTTVSSRGRIRKQRSLR